MNIKESYFDDELREKFFVPSMLKRCWAAEIEVLKDVEDFCKRIHIQYFAEGGTLLGAIRHKGFIPWDDDIDIGLMRKDYDIFISHADELPSNYTLLNWDNDPTHQEPFIRIVNTTKYNLDQDFLERYHNFPFVAGIDIFPFDYLSRDEVLNEERKDRYFRICKILRLQSELEDEKWSRIYEELLNQLEDVEGVQIDRSGEINLQLHHLANRIFSEVSEEEAGDVCCFAEWQRFGTSRCKKEALSQMIDVPFEYTSISAPAGYHYLLEGHFGDYMKPVKGTAAHSFPFYKKDEKVLVEKAGWKSLSYDWNEDDVELPAALRQAEAEKRENIRQQLSQIETLASQGGADLIAALQDQIQTLKSVVENPHPNREEVVFLVEKPETWRSFDVLFHSELEKENTDIFVIPMPYFSLNIDGTQRARIYASNGYPADVQDRVCETYDFSSRKPDRIYFQIPYDDANPFSSVHPIFYSRELVKYTDELIYVPYVALREIDEKEELDMEMMKYYVCMPGLVFADKILLPTDNMKRNYIKTLTEFAGNDWKEYWESKVEVSDYLPED